jgi:lysophospholipase L1-like esterase
VQAADRKTEPMLSLFCAGDSLTTGFGGNRPYSAWLRELVPVCRYQECAGVGWRAEELALALPRVLRSLDGEDVPDGTLLAIGFNDICCLTPPPQWRTHLESIAGQLAQRHTREPQRVKVLSIVPPAQTAFYQQPQAYKAFAAGLTALERQGKPAYQAFLNVPVRAVAERTEEGNTLLEDISSTYGFTYIDLAEFFGKILLESDIEAVYLPEDGVHFTDAVNRQLAEYLLEYVQD